jgi:hypothetical protein
MTEQVGIAGFGGFKTIADTAASFSGGKSKRSKKGGKKGSKKGSKKGGYRTRKARKGK